MENLDIKLTKSERALLDIIEKESCGRSCELSDPELARKMENLHSY